MTLCLSSYFYTTSIRDPKKACQARLLFNLFLSYFHADSASKIWWFLSQNVFQRIFCNEKIGWKRKWPLSYFSLLYVTPFVSWHTLLLHELAIIEINAIWLAVLSGCLMLIFPSFITNQIALRMMDKRGQWQEIRPSWLVQRLLESFLLYGYRDRWERLLHQDESGASFRGHT